MSSANPCPRCGAPRTSTTADGLCPHCLLAGLLEGTPTGRPGEEPGDAVGPYELVDLIGEGGMGSVWRARQLHPVKREVALKIIKLGMDTRELVSRFESERQSLAMMDHPGIARVYEAGATAAGRPYFAMELVEGETVTEYCVSRRLPVAERLRLFLEICAAVEHAHRKGVIHRDLKPSNVLVAERAGGPRVKVIDFGIAKLFEGDAGDRTYVTRDGHSVGTPGYMSPEQAGAAPDLDTRSDVYSLGALLYEMLAGSPPLGRETFRAAAHAEVMRLIRETDPPRPSTRIRPAAGSGDPAPPRIARDLDRIVMKALARERERRYGGAAMLGEDVRRFLDHEPVSATDPTPAYRAGKFIRKHRVSVAFAAGIVLALVVGTVMTAREAAKAREATGRAEAAGRETRNTLADTYRNIGLERSYERDDALAALWFALAAKTAGPDGSRSEANRIRTRLSILRAPIPVGYFERRRPLQSHLRFDGSGRFLLEGSYQGPCVIFDLESGRQVAFEEDPAVAALLPADGLAAISAGDARVEIRDLGTMDAVQRFEVPGEKVDTLWPDESGDLLLAGGLRPRVWSRSGEAFVAGPFAHPLPLRYARFSPDGSLVLTVDEQGDVRIFEVAEGNGGPLMEPIPTASKTHFNPYFPRFHAGGRQIILKSEDRLCRVDLDERRLEVGQDTPDGGDVSEDGRWITGFHGVRGMDTGQPRFSRPIGNSVFTPDDGMVYGNGLAEFLDYDGNRQSKLPARGPRWRFSPDGVLMAHRINTGILIYQIARPEPFLRVHAPYAGRITLSSDQRLFASSGWSRRDPAPRFTRAFRVSDGQPAGPEIDTGCHHLAAAFVPDSTLLMTGGGERSAGSSPDQPGGGEAPGVLQVWDSSSGERVAGPLVLPAEPCVMRAHPTEAWIAVLCWNGELLRVDASLEQYEVIRRLGGEVINPPNWRHQGNLCFSGDGRILYANGLDRRVFALDAETGESRFELLGQNGFGLSLKVGGGTLFTPTPDGGDEWTFEARTGKPLSLPREVRPYMPSGSRIDGNGRRLVISTPTRISVVDLPAGTPVGPGHSAGPPSFVYSEFVEGTPWILSAIGPKLEPPTLRLWDSRAGLELAPRWRLRGYGMADFVTTADGDHAILSIQGVGYVVVKVGELRELLAAPEELSAVERFQLAKIVAMRGIEDGRVTDFGKDGAWAAAWRDFSARHPGLFPPRPAPSMRLRWHRNQEAWFGPDSHAGRWHRQRIEALEDFFENLPDE